MILYVIGKSSDNELDVVKEPVIKKSPQEKGLPCCAIKTDIRKLATMISLSALNAASKPVYFVGIVFALGE
jgi:hypothetical protein